LAKTDSPAGGKKIIALDVGSVRIGVASSDPTGTFAQAVGTLDAKDDWLAGLEKILLDAGADKIIVGLPRRTDGSDGPEARRMKRVAGKISSRFPDIEIVCWDERYTTVIASKALLDADVSRASRMKNVDKIAAAVLLQSYLDAEAEKNFGRTEVPPAVMPERNSGGAKRMRRSPYA
jgi:putative Holliday junction resolvase